MAGGEHATALPEYCLRDCNSIDYISLWEGEETWSEIIKQKDNNFNDIAGLAYLKNDEFVKTIETEAREIFSKSIAAYEGLQIDLSAKELPPSLFE